jgi:phosphoglycolate phosphatase
MKYRLVIFDFDGTLADSFPWFLSIMNDVADKFEFERTAPEAVAELRKLGSKEVLKRLNVAWLKLPLIARHSRKLKAAEAGRINFFPASPRS